VVSFLFVWVFLFVCFFVVVMVSYLFAGFPFFVCGVSLVGHGMYEIIYNIK